MSAKHLGSHSVLLLVVLVAIGLSAGIGCREGAVPNTDFASRRVWGERLFGPYLRHIDGWAAQSELIRRDVGSIQGIAPTGAPNRFHAGFTDGSYAEMNLEVIGTKGTGELRLPYVEIWNTGQLQCIGSDARWRFGDAEHLVVKSGKSYLAEHGLEEDYVELLKLAEQGAAKEFVAWWADFERKLAATSLADERHATNKSRLIPALHEYYREPLLIHFAVALADLDRNDESADAYRQAAELMLARADDLIQEEDGRRELASAATELRRANELLRLANKAVPDDRATLKLARKRVVLQYLHSIGGRPEPVYSANGKYEAQWAHKCLGLFYREAEAYAKRSPYLQQAHGGLRSVRIAPRATSELFVNDRNVYGAYVFLDVAGRNGSGSLLIHIRENHRSCPAIDLFADVPRNPDYPLKIRSPSWTPDGGSVVWLGAKTGQPRKKSSR